MCSLPRVERNSQAHAQPQARRLEGQWRFQSLAQCAHDAKAGAAIRYWIKAFGEADTIVRGLDRDDTLGDWTARHGDPSRDPGWVPVLDRVGNDLSDDKLDHKCLSEGKVQLSARPWTIGGS
jgi:hypothetical protein